MKTKVIIETLTKVGKIAGPVAAGVMAVLTDLEERKQKDLIEQLLKRVADLESKISH